jgi:hypothetical protein
MTEPESDKDASNDVDMGILDKALAAQVKKPKSVALAPVTVHKRKNYHDRDALILTCTTGGGKKGNGVVEQKRAAGKPSKPLIVKEPAFDSGPFSTLDVVRSAAASDEDTYLSPEEGEGAGKTKTKAKNKTVLREMVNIKRKPTDTFIGQTERIQVLTPALKRKAIVPDPVMSDGEDNNTHKSVPTRRPRTSNDLSMVKHVAVLTSCSQACQEEQTRGPQRVRHSSFQSNVNPKVRYSFQR